MVTSCIHGNLLWSSITMILKVNYNNSRCPVLDRHKEHCRAAPVILELLDAVGPNIPNYAHLHEPRELLTQIQQRLTEQEQRIQATFQTPPSPFIPNDDYGFLRRPESRLPAPMLRRSLLPRSRSAPAILKSTTTSSFGDQPWYHVLPQAYMDTRSAGTMDRSSIQTRQMSDEMDISS